MSSEVPFLKKEVDAARPREAVMARMARKPEAIILTDLADVRRQILTAEVLRRGGFKASDEAADDRVLKHCSRPLADKFQVSARSHADSAR